MNKVCTKCKENKPLEEYYKDSRAKDGRRPECKGCHNAMKKKYNKSDKGKTTKAEYRESDKGKLVYAKANAEYRKSDKGKAVQAEYNKSDKGKATHAKHMKTDKGKATATRREHNRRTNEANTINTLKAKEFNCTLFLQNYQCIGLDHEGSRFFDDLEPQRDHIKPVSKGGDFTKETVQALCKSCDSKKGVQEIDYRSEKHKEIIKNLTIN